MVEGQSFQKPVAFLPSGLKQSSVALAQFGALILLQIFATLALGRLLFRQLPQFWSNASWGFGLAMHCAGFLVALALMFVLKPFFGGSFGFSLPKGQSMIWPAFWVGCLVGVLMLGVDHSAELLRARPPQGPYTTNLANMIPWLIIQGGIVGLTEETVFRSLFQSYLLTQVTTRIHVGRSELSLAGILIAVVFSLAHADAFKHVAFVTALGQQIYAIGLGVFCGYLFERSGSILAPVVAHNAADFVEWICRFALRALLS